VRLLSVVGLLLLVLAHVVEERLRKDVGIEIELHGSPKFFFTWRTMPLPERNRGLGRRHCSESAPAVASRNSREVVVRSDSIEVRDEEM